MTNLPYETTHVVSVRTAIKVWDTLGGTSLAPPDGSGRTYDDPLYDDSSWASASNPTLHDPGPNLAPFVFSFGPFTQPEAFSAWSTPAPGTVDHPTSFQFRWRLTPPTGATWRILRIQIDDWSGVAADRSVSYASFVYPYNFSFETFLQANLSSDSLVIGIAQWDSTFGSGLVGDFWVSFRIVYYRVDSVLAGAANGWGTPMLAGADRGVLGVGDTTAHLTATACAGGLTNIAKVVSNGTTTLFLTQDGLVYACGDNSQGLALPTGSTDALEHSTPVQILGPISGVVGPNTYNTFPFLDISIGAECALGLDLSGIVWGWGPNTSGSLGRGNTTPVLVPTALNPSGSGSGFPAAGIGAGKNFAAVAYFHPVDLAGPQLLICTAGDNTYGQLGTGTTVSHTSWQQIIVPIATISGTDIVTTQVSAGDDQLIVLSSDLGSSPYACGRAEYGSLGGVLYSAGTGANHIVSTFTAIASGMSSSQQQVEQAGLLSFFRDDGATLGYIGVLGDGTPYGGAGDHGYNSTTATFDNYPPAIVYGQTAYPNHGTVFINDLFFDIVSNRLWPVDGLAICSGGSQNASTPGASRDVFAAYGYHPTNDITQPSDALLYTWGWGGAGQMGSGADPLSNPAPVSINGMSDVVGACVANGIMFAISTTGIVTTTLVKRGRAFGQIIG